ncbi:hypothetical protein ACFCV3_12615 [Kribbella sp. NPDC056345]|uniref:hypothetical protein n=1 Tax=Kribbella sp. NPDC056345 TaxID=3345789 RepID=UPI0035E3053A
MSHLRRALLPGMNAGVLLVLCVVSPVLVGCSIQEDPNPDPRAYTDSAGYVTLDKALKDNGITLPEDASEVRFGSYVGQDESFDLTFGTGCGSVPRFLQESSLKGELEQSTLLPSLVEGAGSAHGWKIDSYREPRGIEDDRWKSVLRSVVVAKDAEGACKVFLSALR